MERNRRGRPRHPDVLTPAEWRVLDALREGGTNAEIAARLGLSLDTVKYHISNMLAKLELRDRRALASWRPRSVDAASARCSRCPRPCGRWLARSRGWGRGRRRLRVWWWAWSRSWRWSPWCSSPPAATPTRPRRHPATDADLDAHCDARPHLPRRRVLDRRPAHHVGLLLRSRRRPQPRRRPTTYRSGGSCQPIAQPACENQRAWSGSDRATCIRTASRLCVRNGSVGT